MEKLNKSTVEFLQKLIKTCNLCGIDAVAIEPDVIRGQALDNSKGTFLLEQNNIPKNTGFTSLGIGRVKVLGTRIAILDSSDTEISFEGKERDNGDIMVKKLQLTNKKTKIEYSCYDSTRIKAPKKFTDPVCYEFSIATDTLNIMAKAVAAIETSKISFSSEKDGSVKFRTSDIEGDTFDHLVADTYGVTDDTDKAHFYYAYEIKYVLPLFRAAIESGDSFDVTISKRGILKIQVNNFDIYVLPES
jgi:hypothetical protein